MHRMRAFEAVPVHYAYGTFVEHDIRLRTYTDNHNGGQGSIVTSIQGVYWLHFIVCWTHSLLFQPC